MKAMVWPAAIIWIFAASVSNPAPSLAAVGFSSALRMYASYCANCHGKWGHGDGVVAPVLKTKPKDLTDPAAIAKFSDEKLFKAIKEGGPAVGLSKDMPGWGQGLDDDQIRALVVYVKSLSRR